MSCGDGEFVYTQERTLDDFKEYRDGAFEVNGDEVLKNLANMAAADQGGLSADKFTRNYYKEKGKPLWIDYKGIDWRVDSLEEWLKATETVGISPAVFNVIPDHESCDFGVVDIVVGDSKVSWLLQQSFL